MYWILAALILLPTLLVPRFRPAGVVGCIILAALLVWGMVQRIQRDAPAATQQRGAPSSPAAGRVALDPALIKLDEIKLTGSGAPFELRGEVTNGSPELRLRTITVRIIRRDCYEGAIDPSGCATLWQDRHWINISVPPQQARQFAVSIWPHGTLPRTRGSIRDEFTVVSAVGEPVPEVRSSGGP